MLSDAGSLRRDPAFWIVILAVALAAALYAPTLTRGLVSLDDDWLIHRNWIVQDASWSSLHSIFFDTTRDTRVVLGAEYLPVRDLSVMLDSAIWGDAYAGFHLTNLALYLAAIVGWFIALCELGIERRVAAVAVLVWAVHPSHAESVAWLAERKGLLAVALTSIVAIGFARFRAGRSVGWIVLAVVAAVVAVWSKALAAFVIAGLAGLEVVLPARRVSWRRSIAGLCVLAIATAVAFAPVLIVASRMAVVSGEDAAGAHHAWLAMVLGVNGFYARLALLATPSAVSYPIDTDGPTLLDIVLGAVALGVLLATLAPRLGRREVPPVLRAAGVLWLAGWFPVSRLVLPVRLVVAADRYLLFPTLGLGLAFAVGALALPRRRLVIALVTAVVVASGARSLAAQASWRDSRTLWQRAVESNPRDATAWSMYAEALIDAGALDDADRAIEQGLTRTGSPRLQLRRALLLARRGDRAGSMSWMQRAADGGEAIAMANLAVMLAEAGNPTAGIEWARKAVAVAPLYAHGYQILGKLALAAALPEEARAGFERAYALEPASCVNRYNLALALIALDRRDEARTHLLACFGEPAMTGVIWSQLVRIAR